MIKPGNIRVNPLLNKSNLYLSASRDGFTLVEIIVSVAIVVILSGTLIVYSRRAEKQILLNVEKAKVAQAILRTKELTLAGFTKPPSNPPPCSYGFRINYTNETYSLFEYIPPAPTTCDNILTITSITPNPPNYRETESNTLNPKLDFDTGPDRLGYLLLVPPDPKVLLFDEGGNIFQNNPMNIYIRTDDPVNPSGATIRINNITAQLSFPPS